MTVIEVERGENTKKVFAADTDIPWKSKGGCVGSNGKSFLLSMNKNLSFEIHECFQKSFEVYHDAN